jgi:putative ABC transport system permease protein
MRPDKAVADERLGLDIGDEFVLGGTDFEVVGLVSGMTMIGGTPDVWISLDAAQGALFQGEDIVTTIVVQGEPQAPPYGLVLMTGPATSPCSRPSVRRRPPSSSESRSRPSW